MDLVDLLVKLCIFAVVVWAVIALVRWSQIVIPQPVIILFWALVAIEMILFLAKAFRHIAFAFAILACCVGCAGTGEGGRWTPADTDNTVRAVNGIYGTGVTMYRDYQNGYQARPTVVIP